MEAMQSRIGRASMINTTSDYAGKHRVQELNKLTHTHCDRGLCLHAAIGRLNGP